MATLIVTVSEVASQVVYAQNAFGVVTGTATIVKVLTDEDGKVVSQQYLRTDTDLPVPTPVLVLFNK